MALEEIRYPSTDLVEGVLTLAPIQEHKKSDSDCDTKLPKIAAHLGDIFYHSPLWPPSQELPHNQNTVTAASHYYNSQKPCQSNGDFRCLFKGCSAGPFEGSERLKFHQFEHSGAFYFCSVEGCHRGKIGNGFKRPDMLKRHAAVHIRHYCSFEGCERGKNGKGFPILARLRSHEIIHSSDATYFCPVEGCENGKIGNGFKSKESMKRHLKRHAVQHNPKPFKCMYCRCACGREDDLNR